MKKSLDLVLYFDGSCVVNPGGPMFYGWHCETEDGQEIGRSYGRIDDYPPELQTNNIAEYEALLSGLQWLASFKAATIDSLTVRGDSQLIVKTVNGEWQCKKPHLVKLRDECLNELKHIDAGHIQIEWIPREKNEKADILSKST